MPPRKRAEPAPAPEDTSYYEVVKVGPEWCLRIRATGKPVAWSRKDDAAWQSYVREAQAAVARRSTEDV